ncbi:hypothetical protein H0H93_013571 [Arthromyces matolae]|nr:hypothetical protein H0H93_013571 [Arthromyces matolae]
MPRRREWFNVFEHSKRLENEDLFSNSLPLFQNDSRQRWRLRAFKRTLSCHRVVYILLIVLAVYTVNVLFHGIPSTYQDVRQFERSLAQHNLPRALENQTRYLRISKTVTGRGFNNVLQEALLLSYLATVVNRSYVFEDYVWSHSPLPYTLYDTSLRPSRMPINAFISGPTTGGEMSYPRAISSEFWASVCPSSNRKIISSRDQPDGVEGSVLLDWWKGKLDGLDDRCVEIETEKKEIFDFMIFGDTKILSLWPGLSQSPILTSFQWSSLVHSILDDNRGVVQTGFVTDSPSSANDSMLKGLVAVHLRRGDFDGHCKFLLRWKASYMGFNRFPEMIDNFDPWKYREPEMAKRHYMDHCIPEVDVIVERLNEIRKANPGVNRVYALTNGKRSWMNTLKTELLRDGWLDVKSSLDLRMDATQRQVSVAVDMAIAERAEVFLGNGFDIERRGPALGKGFAIIV